MSTYSIIVLIDEQFSYHTAHHWAVATSMSTYSGILATNFLWGETRKRVWWLHHDPRFFSPRNPDVSHFRAAGTASMPLHDIIVIHCGIVPTSLIAASCRLFCCMSSSCDFHIVLFLYTSGIRCHSHTPVRLCCYESSMRPYKVFLVASCWLWLRHHCRLNSSSGRMTCGIIAVLKCRLAGRLASSLPSWLIFIVASLPLPHSWGTMLLWKQYETIQGLSCDIVPALIAASLPTWFVVW
jgi:hypothetical protein